MSLEDEKHMPEPWDIGPRTSKYRSIESLFPAFDALSIGRADIGQACLVPLDESNRATAERIVACVNACIGMEDPVTEIAELTKDKERKP